MAALNVVMTGLRKKARSAPLGKFHKFIHRAFDENRVAKCLTRNFDGLETRDRPDLATKILMVHGDNRVLRCSARNCAGVTGQETIELEEDLLKGILVECTSCSSKGSCCALPLTNGSNELTFVPLQKSRDYAHESK